MEHSLHFYFIEGKTVALRRKMKYLYLTDLHPFMEFIIEFWIELRPSSIVGFLLDSIESVANTPLIPAAIQLPIASD